MLISFSLALSQIPAYFARPLIGDSVHLDLYHFFLVDLFIAPISRMDRLSWSGWLITYREGLTAHRWLPSQS